MSRITVQRQCWQRWPRVLIAERRNDDGTVDERRYVPEGGTRDQWNGEVRETVRKLEATRKKLDVRLREESELPNMQAEIDGLQWEIEERDRLIRDMLEARCGETCAGCGHEHDEGCEFMTRALDMGIAELTRPLPERARGTMVSE